MFNAENTECIFCNGPLDNSDEHIIPDALNGKLHSKKIICHACNQKFGRYIDPIGKEIFNPILLFLGFNNADALRGSDENDNENFFLGKNFRTSQIKPQGKVIEKDGKTIYSISGNPRDVNNIKKKISERAGKHGLNVDFTTYYKYSASFFSVKYEIKKSEKLILLISKIAYEFSAVNNSALKITKELRKKVYDLSDTIDNIKFCNFQNEIRDFHGEISHLILLKSDLNENILYIYIELFNIVCAFIPLDLEYKGPEISILYHQDAVTGERFSDPINLKKSPRQIIDYVPDNEEFSFLISSLLYRNEQRISRKLFIEGLDFIKNNLDKKIADGVITEDEFNDIAYKEATQFAGQFLVDMPYMLDDLEDEKDDELNYIHSNFREEIVDTFLDDNKHLLGLKLIAPSGNYIVHSFFKHPIAVKASIKLITIYCKLIHEETDIVVYIKVSDLIRDINQALSNT